MGRLRLSCNDHCFVRIQKQANAIQVLSQRIQFFFPKQFTVGVLNATLDLAALVLVGVVGFLGSEVVLSPVVSGCLPSYGGWVLVGVAAFLGSGMVVSLHVGGGSWLVWPHLEQNIQKSKSQVSI